MKIRHKNVTRNFLRLPHLFTCSLLITMGACEMDADYIENVEQDEYQELKKGNKKDDLKPGARLTYFTLNQNDNSGVPELGKKLSSVVVPNFKLGKPPVGSDVNELAAWGARMEALFVSPVDGKHIIQVRSIDGNRITVKDAAGKKVICEASKWIDYPIVEPRKDGKCNLLQRPTTECVIPNAIKGNQYLVEIEYYYRTRSITPPDNGCFNYGTEVTPRLKAYWYHKANEECSYPWINRECPADPGPEDAYCCLKGSQTGNTCLCGDFYEFGYFRGDDDIDMLFVK